MRKDDHDNVRPRPTRPDVSGPAGEVTEHPLHAGMLDVQLRSLAAIRREVAGHARRCGLTDQRIRDAVLVANELATNVIRHGGGAGRMWLWCVHGSLLCRVSDGGPGIANPDRAGLPPTERMSIAGRGLWLVEQLSQAMHIETGASGTTITVVMTPLASDAWPEPARR